MSTPLLRPLLALDAELFRVLNSHHLPWADALLRVGTELGQGWVLALLLLAGILALVPADNRRRAIAAAAAAMCSNSLVLHVLKRLAARPRPLRYFDDPALAAGFHVHLVGPALRHNSFPSGHASAAFCAATLAVLLFGRRWWPGYLAAAFVAYSRVYVGAHFPLDALAGAVLGTCVALAFAPALRRRLPRGRGGA